MIYSKMNDNDQQPLNFIKKIIFYEISEPSEIKSAVQFIYSH